MAITNNNNDSDNNGDEDEHNRCDHADQDLGALTLAQVNPPEDPLVRTQTNPLANIQAADVALAANVGINLASFFTAFGFETAKFSTRFGLHVARVSVQTVSSLISAAAGPSLAAPVTASLAIAESTLSLAEFFALAGIDLTSKTVEVSLVAAKESMTVLEQLFGSNETSRALGEFAQLVRREWNHELEETFLPANMQPFSLVSTISAITAWAALQHVTAEQTRQSMQCYLRDIPLQHRNGNDNGNGSDSDDGDATSLFENDVETMRITQRQGEIVEGELETDPSIINVAHGDGAPGIIPSLFDRVDELPSMQRLSKFCMGAYGRDSMRFFGVNLPPLPETPLPGLNRHHYTFAHFNGIPLDNVLGMPRLQSERDVANSFTPAFYIIRDHASRAIILALRGTFSLNDLAIDLTCEYADFQVPADEGAGPSYKVHKGILDSALSVVTGEVGRAVRTALEDNEGYGLCLCGHSLGAGIASLLALLWSDPTTSLTHASSNLPPGRRLHAYCFASPCSVDPILSRRSRTIVTALVYSSDVVGRLSLGHVLDLRNMVAWLQERTEEETLSRNIISRALQYHTSAFATGEKATLEVWFSSIRSTLLANMQSDKMYPPGRVLWVNEVRGDLKMMETESVEEVFGEMRFGTDMLSSHMPWVYDNVLKRL